MRARAQQNCGTTAIVTCTSIDQGRNRVSWIRTIPYEDADPTLKKIYDRVRGPDGRIDNILMLHSLRPHTLVGHMGLYKNVLHNSQNVLPMWLVETVGVYVSMLNRCQYCVEHHFVGLAKWLGDNSDDDARATQIRQTLENDSFAEVFNDQQQLMLAYARQLTLEPWTLTESSILRLRDAGVDDGMLLELNQIVAYFAYANRTVLGLGGNLEGDVLGLSPNAADDADDWSHQ
jgi:uncharacterized peroxidase-related enzyme